MSSQPEHILPAVTVAILNWNGRKFLKDFLPSVLATTYPNFTVLVTDNASSDDSVAMLKEDFPQVKILELAENYGFAEGYNRTMPHIKDPYVVLLNSDVEVEPDWLGPLVEYLQEHPQAAGVQPKIRAHAQRGHFEYAGAAGGFIDRYGYPFCRGRIFDELEPDRGQYDSDLPVFWATGACMMLRTSVVEKIGLFEKAFFAHMEEIDFCWRAQNFGYTLGVEPRSLVYHVGGGTLPQGNPRKTFLNVRNSLIMMHTNLPHGQVFKRIMARLLLDGVWALRLALGREWKSIGAILRAHWAYYGHLGRWQKRRRHIYRQGFPRTWPVHGMWAGSIVWQHFARGKKHWSDLYR